MNMIAVQERPREAIIVAAQQRPNVIRAHGAARFQGPAAGAWFLPTRTRPDDGSALRCGAWALAARLRTLRPERNECGRKQGPEMAAAQMAGAGGLYYCERRRG